MATPLRIVMIEESPDDAELALALLVRAGYEPACQHVNTEEDFLAAIRTTPDIILACYCPAQFDGLHALQLTLDSGLEIPFILISEMKGEEQAVAAMRMGASDYLLKDHLTRLGQAVANTLSSRAKRSQQKRIERSLPQRIALEQLAISISSHLHKIGPAELEESLVHALQEVAQLVHADHTYIHLFDSNPPTLSSEYAWHSIQEAADIAGMDLIPVNLEQSFGWTIARLRDNQVVYITGIDHLPPDAASERALWEQQGLKSFLMAPLKVGEALLGVYTMSTSHQGFQFDADNVTVFKLLGDTFANVIVRTQTEETLYNELSQLRAVVDTVPDPIIAKNRDGQIILANRAAAAMLGASPVHMLGKSDEDLYPHELVARNKAIEQNVLASGLPSPNHEEKLLDPAGNEHWMLSTQAPMQDATGEIRGIVSVRRDITARTLAAEQAKRQLETLSALYAGVRALTSTLDLQGLMDDATSICVQTFGAGLAWIGLAEPDGRVRFVSQYPPDIDYSRRITLRWDDVPAGQGPTGTAIRTGKPVIDRDFQTISEFAPWQTPAIEAGFTCSASFPLTSHGRTFGALNVYFAHAYDLTDERVAFFESYSLQLAAALENARLFEQTERSLQRVQSLHAISTAISSSLESKITLNVILENAISRLQVDAADILLLDQESSVLSCEARRGFITEAMKETRMDINRSNAGRAARERRTIHLENAPDERSHFLQAFPMSEERFKTYFGVPLICKGQVLGVLEIYNRTALNPDAEWLQFLEALAAQSAVAVETYAAISDLKNTNTDLTAAYDATIEGWSRALELRDQETAGHALRVVDLTLRIGRKLGLKGDQLVHMRRGALLHDIGKLGVPDRILLKPGPLNDDEWVIMRMHVQFAIDMLKPIAYLRPALDIPKYHHESWDGTGYPHGLKGAEIPLAARIFSAVDVWDALNHDRPYRKAWPASRVREHMQADAGKHLDSVIVQALLQVVDEELLPVESLNQSR